MFFRIIFSLLPLLFFVGCATKEVAVTSSTKHITILTKGLKYSDQGFLKESKNSVSAELYSFGNPVLKLEVFENRICLDGSCYTKRLFIDRFLTPAYYEDILGDILSQREIFEGKNLQEDGKKRIQKISSEMFDILYTRENGSLSFIDKVNGIKIVVR